MSNPYVGEIRMFGGNFAPVGWEFCQGQLMSISDNDTLFNLIGTTYGGDGVQTFALPNLQSRIPVHQGQNYPLSMMAGVEQVTLTQTQLPVHTHQATGSTQNATLDTPTGNVWGAWAQTGYSSATPTVSMASNALTAAGGNQPHDNMPPFLVINFIISMFGIYPSPS